jgi:hypothetical protein
MEKLVEIIVAAGLAARRLIGGESARAGGKTWGRGTETHG